MRRIVAILLGIFVVFWIAYGLFDPWQKIVNNVAIKVVGPTIFGALTGTYNMIIATLGVAGFSVIMLGFGSILGFVIYHYWHKVDWSVRRWAAKRTASDLGTVGVSQIPATPSYATTRPAVTETATPKLEEKTVEPVKEEVKANE